MDTPSPSAQNSISTSGSIGLSYSQTLFDNFATDAAVAGAQARYEAASFAAVNAEQNVLLNVATSHFDVIANRRIVEIRQENIGFLEAQLGSARDRLELGEGTPLAVSQAQAALAQGQASYQGAIANLRNTEASYLRFVGRSPSVANDAGSIASLLPSNLDAAMTIASAEHPGLLASAAAIRAAQYQAEETQASFGPELSLSAQTGVNGLTSGTWSPSAQVGLSLTIPIYVPTRDPALEQANIGRIQSELDARVTYDTVFEAIRQAWAGMDSATTQIEAATAAVAAGRIALQAIVDQSDLGTATVLDVLDARGTLLQSEEVLVSAQTQRSIAGYSLLSAMGRLTAANLGLPVVLRSADGSVAMPADDQLR